MTRPSINVVLKIGEVILYCHRNCLFQIKPFDGIVVISQTFKLLHGTQKLLEVKTLYIQEFTSHFCLRDSGHQLISNLEGVNLAAVDRLQHAGHTEDPRRVLEQAGSGFEDFVDVVIPCDIGFREPPARLRI